MTFTDKKTGDDMNDFPKRKQIRLNDYNYSQNGYYFITICTKERKTLFWDYVGADTIRPNLSNYGKIVKTAIEAIPKHYPNASVDKYVIMPDHIHLILVISNNGINGQMLSAPTPPTVMRVIGQLKRWVSKQIGFSIWQKSFFEHIIRDETDYITKTEYILNNPLKYSIQNRR